MRRSSTLLGRDTDTGDRVFINDETRALHKQVIGSTGTGKSKFLEHLIREDIRNNKGLCLIDPHGYLYNDIINWCETKRMLERKKIILFDPSEEGWTFGFNPLKICSAELSFLVDGMVKACAQVWGGEDLDKTPLLKRCLRNIFHALAEKKLSLLEANYLVTPHTKEIRQYLTKNIEDPIIRGQWEYFNTLKPREFEEKFSSTINRLMEFFSSPIIRRIIGQIERTVDFRKIMDEGWMLLVNLASSNLVSEQNARLLGALIINDLFTKARGRPKNSRPFYLYIDECALFINEDVGRILDEGRKFGLHLILAHQHLAQLKEAGEKVYQSVMTNAKTKVIFGGLGIDDARILAEQIFLGDLDLEEAKTTLNKPTVIGFIKTWLENYSKAEGTSRGTGRTEGGGSISSIGSGMASVYPLMGISPASQTVSSHSGETRSSHWASTTHEAELKTESNGGSEAFEPVFEEMPTQVFSLEEQLHKKMALMVNQPTQHAIIKLPGKISQTVKVPTISEGYARAERAVRFKKQCYQLADFAKPTMSVDKEIKERWLLIEKKAKKAGEIKGPEDPENFRE